MPPWAKALTLLVGLGGYSATVITMLVHGKIPDIGTLGIPAALIIALAPPLKIGRGRASRTKSSDNSATTEDEVAE